jgi:hypothetical protein
MDDNDEPSDDLDGCSPEWLAYLERTGLAWGAVCEAQALCGYATDDEDAPEARARPREYLVTVAAKVLERRKADPGLALDLAIAVRDAARAEFGELLRPDPLPLPIRYADPDGEERARRIRDEAIDAALRASQDLDPAQAAAFDAYKEASTEADKAYRALDAAAKEERPRWHVEDELLNPYREATAERRKAYSEAHDRAWAAYTAAVPELADPAVAAAAQKRAEREARGLERKGRLLPSNMYPLRMYGVLERGKVDQDDTGSELDAGAPVLRNGVPLLDSHLADLLEKLGDDRAEKIRKSELGDTPTKVWRRWIPDAATGFPPATAILFEAVLSRLLAERERAKASRPAVVRQVVADAMLPTMTRQEPLPGLDDGTLRDGRRRVIGTIAATDSEALEAVREGLALFGSPFGHRLFRSLVTASHAAWERGEQDPRLVRYHGGLSGLAEALGYKGKDGPQKAKLVLEAGELVRFRTKAFDRAGLWLWEATRGSRGRPGEVLVTLSNALSPGYAAELASARTADTIGMTERIGRRLVPELPHDPPLSAVRPNEQGAVWTLGRLFVLELVDNAEELFSEGGVIVSPDRWRELASKARVPIVNLARVLSSWRSGDNDAPPLLAGPEAGRVTLAEPHALVRAFLEEQGRKRAEGRRNAKKGKAKKGEQKGQ